MQYSYLLFFSFYYSYFITMGFCLDDYVDDEDDGKTFRSKTNEMLK